MAVGTQGKREQLCSRQEVEAAETERGGARSNQEGHSQEAASSNQAAAHSSPLPSSLFRVWHPPTD